jgi:hypothetical protein
LRPRQPPKHATAADKAYCCAACKASKKADEDPKHGPSCERVPADGGGGEAFASGGGSSRGGGCAGGSAAAAALAAPTATWSGKTPKELLEEWCRKNGRPPPLFSQLPRGSKPGGKPGDGWVCSVRPAAAAHAPKHKKGRGKPLTKAQAAAEAAEAAEAAAAVAAAAARAAASTVAGGEASAAAWMPPKPAEAVVAAFDAAAEGDVGGGGTALFAAATKALYYLDRYSPLKHRCVYT